MNPLTIYQEALDVVTQAVFAGDFDCYAAMIDLPYLVHTAAADLLVTTTDDLRPTFDALAAGLKARGVTHYERIARKADFVARDRIEGWHHTHVLAHGESLAYPHAASHTLVRRGERWLFSQAHYGFLQSRSWPLTDSHIFGHIDHLVPNEAET